MDQESRLQLIEDGRLSSIIQTHKNDFVLCRESNRKKNRGYISPELYKLDLQVSWFEDNLARSCIICLSATQEKRTHR